MSDITPSTDAGTRLLDSKEAGIRAWFTHDEVLAGILAVEAEMREDAMATDENRRVVSLDLAPTEGLIVIKLLSDFRMDEDLSRLFTTSMIEEAAEVGIFVTHQQIFDAWDSLLLKFVQILTDKLQDLARRDGLN